MCQGKAADDFPRGNTKTVYVKARGFGMDFRKEAIQDVQVQCHPWFRTYSFTLGEYLPFGVLLSSRSEVRLDFNLREELFFKSDDKEIFEGIIKDFKEAHFS